MRELFFFIGTEAELIKVFPVIIECKKRQLNCHIIASGQNDIRNSAIISNTECEEVELELSKESEIHKSTRGLLIWWIKTYYEAVEKIRDKYTAVDFSNSDMIIHGDTVSTYMGARIGRKLGMTVCHVEAGLRSHHIFSPFPEEIDRMLTCRIARVHFAPGDNAYNNLRDAKGKVINTRNNTLIDSLEYSKNIPIASKDVEEIVEEDYFVFVMHRQENLVNKAFVSNIVKEIVCAAKKMKCIIVLHKITENTIIKCGLMNELQKNKNIRMIPRVDYFDFMKLLQNSKFVITDGGSNQEELYYMQKPCLILRTATERNEGLGMNARLFNGKASDITTFLAEYRSGEFRGDKVINNHPTNIIVDALMGK